MPFYLHADLPDRRPAALFYRTVHMKLQAACKQIERVCLIDSMAAWIYGLRLSTPDQAMCVGLMVWSCITMIRLCISKSETSKYLEVFHAGEWKLKAYIIELGIGSLDFEGIRFFTSIRDQNVFETWENEALTRRQ